MESFADDSSADYGYSRPTARRGSLESVEYGRYKNPARRGSMGSVAEDSYEYRGYKNPSARRASIDSADLTRNKSIVKAAEPAPAPSAGVLLKPRATGSTDAGFLIKPPRRASLAGNATHLLLKNEAALIKPLIRSSLSGAGVAPYMLSKNEAPATRNPASGTQRQSTAESSSHTAGKADFRNYKSTMTRRASLGSGTAGYQGNITRMSSQNTHVNSQIKKGSGLSRPQQQQQQRPQRRFSNMSDYATDSIADVIVESGGIKRVLGHSSCNSTKRRFSTNSCCPSQGSGEASVCSFSSRAA
jgi:hypothetical protein